MNIIYFDRNVFADISRLRRGLTEGDVAKLRSAVDSGAISIPASYTVIEETLALLIDSAEEYRAQIATVLDLINKHTIIKPHHQLIRDDCISYAHNTPYVRTTRTPQDMEALLNLSINANDLQALAQEIREFYDKTARERQADFDRLIAETKEAGFSGGLGNFKKVWDTTSLIIVEGMVKRLPRTEKRLCRKGGIENMLNIKSIRIAVLYECWLLYSHWLKREGTPSKVKPSEAGDFFHAVCASAAHIFVTQESSDKSGKLPFILELIPIPGFQVMNLNDFFDTLSK